MPTPTLQDFVNQISDHIADAQTSASEQEKKQHVYEGMRLMCRFLTRLSLDLGKLIDQPIARTSLSSQNVPLPLNVLAQTEPELEVFRDEATFGEFLTVLGNLLREQARLSEAMITTTIAECRYLYQAMLDVAFDADAMREDFDKLKSYVCRSPNGGGGGSVPDGPHDDSGPSIARRLLGHLQTFGAVASIAQLAFLLQTADPQPSGEPLPPERPLPVRVDLLLLLLIAVISRGLNRAGLIPERSPNQRHPTPETEEVLEDESAGAGVPV
jgi:hypothetical protein